MRDDDVVIVPYQDGPYLVRGPVVLRDQDGRRIEVHRRVIALCRCGRSRTRPFCDGILARIIAPLWLLERGTCASLAVRQRIRYGGVRYGDSVIARAADSRRVLRRRLCGRLA